MIAALGAIGRWSVPGARSDFDVIADELDELALRRRHHLNDFEDIKRQIRNAVDRAQGHMSVAEIARRLELDRSTLYRVYLNGG